MCIRDRLTGYNNTSILIRTHLLGGILAAFSGMIMLARMNSARADFGTSYTMQAILMAVLGGVNPNGGFGSISGVIIAGFILQMCIRDRVRTTRQSIHMWNFHYFCSETIHRRWVDGVFHSLGSSSICLRMSRAMCSNA